ncbi:MAG: hypothetical protein LAQ30_07650 [Acidobacteriia bacterium]|nr:hypothetical protein [Terriglobia bacterium]
MKNLLTLTVVALAAAALPARAGILSLDPLSPATPGSSFDVALKLSNAFAGLYVGDFITVTSDLSDANQGSTISQPGRRASPSWRKHRAVGPDIRRSSTPRREDILTVERHDYIQAGRINPPPDPPAPLPALTLQLPSAY